MTRQSHFTQTLRAGAAALCCALLIVPLNAFASPAGVYLPKTDWFLHSTDPAPSASRGADRFGAAEPGLMSDDIGRFIDSIILAQAEEPTGGGSDPSSTSDRTTETAPAVISERFTLKLIKRLRETRDVCQRIDYLYRIDCLRVEFREIARTLPRTGDYALAGQALTSAADRLERIVKSNADSTRPKISPTPLKPAAKRIQPLIAVKPSAVRAASVAATKVIADTATILLRSTENSERREVSYQEIAQAIDSTKILLRSA